MKSEQHFHWLFYLPKVDKMFIQIEMINSLIKTVHGSYTKLLKRKCSALYVRVSVITRDSNKVARATYVMLATDPL